ncbi:MAG: hypothetical protein K9M15_02870 [Candidatus Marinimicrobia bacterium]|nr:hypothetical protein [Candidatus Neomarinimicrobiota bacterium]
MGLKPRIAIYDFTDCEGCEVQLVSLRDKLLALEEKIDVVDWRLGQERREDGPFFATIIEGTPVTQDEIDTLKRLRDQSTYIIALGACASLGGIPGIMDKEDREKWYKKIYGEQYKPKGIDALPLQAYVKVDFFIHGCPVDQKELERVFSDLLSGKKLSYHSSSVCFECKLAGNKCRLINNKPCLGPITQSGCGAVCISNGSPCYGCFGNKEGANTESLKKILEKFSNKNEIDRYFSMFLNKMEKDNPNNN